MAQKLPEADREAARLLAIQSAAHPTSRRADTALTALFLGVILGLSALFWILPDRAKSENENRMLAEMPEISAQALLDGTLSAEIADYMADQFPARDFFVETKAAAELALGRRGNNSVLLARGGTLLTREAKPSLDNMRENLDAIAAFQTWAAAEGIPVTLAVAGRSYDVLPHTLPAPLAGMAAAESDALWETLRAESASRSLAALDLMTPLRERAAAGEYVYYRTDHHWTSLGAYYGYREIVEALGETPRALDAFTREIASDAFCGTTWSTAGMFWLPPDTMEYFRWDGDDAIRVTTLPAGAETGLYDRAYLSQKDKYSSFLGGNHALQTVVDPSAEAERKTLLVVKDSFAHAVIPMLARDYDLVVIDLRYYFTGTAADAVRDYGCDAVLLLYNIDSLTASASQRMLAAGVE